MRGSEGEAFSGAMIEAMHGESDVLTGDGIETQFLRKELPDESVHVLIGPALPGSIGMGEEEIRTQFSGNVLVLGELPTVVGRQRMNASRKRRQQGDHGSRDGIGGLGWHMGDQGEAGLSPVERDQRLLVTGANHQVGFPVAEACSPIDDGGALLNRHLIGDRAASIAAPMALSACLLATQGAVQCAARAPVSVDALVDGFVTDARLVGGLEIAGDLFRTPQFGELGFGEGPCVRTNAAAVLTGPHAGL